MLRRAAVLGKPVTHSLSPLIHNAGYAAAGLDGWSYTAIECAEAELPDLVAGLGPEWAGLSLTMPLKAAALSVAGAASPLAVTLGAANTLVRRTDGWFAGNTDAGGMVDALLSAGGGAGADDAGRPLVHGSGGFRGAGPRSIGERVLDASVGLSVAVLGAGGTARAALEAARELGAGEVAVYARRAAAVDELRPVAAALGLAVSHVDWSRVAEAGAADVVVSTVPAGAVPPLHWGPSTVLLDVLYHPWPTPLAASAEAAGCRVVSGLDLLLAQAVRQFVIFTGVDAPVGAMRAALARRPQG